MGAACRSAGEAVGEGVEGSGRQGTRREEPGSVALTVEETEACTVIPLRMTMAHGAGGNTGATEAKVGGTDNGAGADDSVAMGRNHTLWHKTCLFSQP